VRILVTGADGFVGARLVPRLAADGHEVTAAIRRGTGAPRNAARVVELELREAASVAACAESRPDAVVHLAAVASGLEARRDPGAAWEVNAAGTARLCEALAAPGAPGPVCLVVSTAEVYGMRPGTDRRRETDPVAPVSPYAASKLGAEIAALEVGRRTGLRVMIARPFPHTGAGQNPNLVVPAFARRLREARARGRDTIAVGNLDVVRDFLHVDDVVEAYLALLRDGESGEIYNVASGEPVRLADLLARLAAMVGVTVHPAADPELVRAADIPHLVGDAAKLRARTAWAPRRSLDDALAEVLGAQAD
jgi:GDP-4-dehydro-6-deoxy-D-mannose reductase